MKVALLTQYPFGLDIRGGVESSMVGLVNELEKYDELELHVVTCTKLINKDRILNEQNTTFYYIHSPKLPQLFTSITTDQYRVKSVIKKINPDIVHAHMSAPLYGYPASKSGYPTIITVHGVVTEESKTWRGTIGAIKRMLYTSMERHVFKDAKTLVAITPYVEQKIRQLSNKKIFVIPNGVQDLFFDIRNEEVPGRLLFIGGLEPRKGLQNLLKAIHVVKEEVPGAALHIVGGIRKKWYYDSLKNDVSTLGLRHHVKFSGSLSTDALKKEISECSVFVFPSLEESQGIVLLEAMAASKPVVATNIGGIPYVVDNGITGTLVEYGDVEALACNIIKLLKDKDLRDQYGRNGRKKAEQFSNKNVAKQYYELYKSILGAP